MSGAALEQRGGLVHPALAAPQLAETREAVGRHARTADRQLIARAGQFAFGLFPRAAPYADRRVLRPADGEERLEAPFPAVLLDAVAPLHGAPVVAHAIARPDQVAAGEADEQAIGQLASQDRRADLVELAKPLRHPAGRHQREAAQRPSEHFVVDRAEQLSDANRLDGQRFGGFGVAVVEKGERGGARRQKRMLRRFGLPVEQPAGTVKPSPRDTFFAAERGAVPRDPDGDPRGRHQIAAVAILAIGTLPRIEDDAGEVEPPRGEAETLQCLRRLLGRQCALEGVLRLLPGSRVEGGLAGGKIVDRSRGRHLARLYRRAVGDRPSLRAPAVEPSPSAAARAMIAPASSGPRGSTTSRRRSRT